MSRPAASAPGDVSVVTSGHDVADARLHRLVAGFRRAGLRVQVLGLGSATAAPAADSVVTRSVRSRWGRLVDDVRLPWRAQGRVVVVLDPDLVPSARARRAVRGGAVVVDVHEDYAALLDDRSWARGLAGRVARTGVAWTTHLSASADLTVVADEQVPPVRARRRRVVRNLPDTEVLPPTSAPDPVPRAVYVGDVRRSRGLWAMLDAVAAAPPWELDVVGPVAPGDTAQLADWVDRSPAADRVRLHGRRPPAEAWRLASGAWCGLVLLEDTPAFRAAMPTKVYEYLGCGLAVVTSALPRPAQLVGDTGAGVVVTDADGAAAALRSWAADPEPLLAARAAASRWAEQNLYGRSVYDDLAVEVARLARKDA